MKVKLKDVLPNPFRDIDTYPIDPSKVEALEASISKTGLWPVLIGRKSKESPGKVELAFGHHRLAACRNLFKTTHEIDVHILSLGDDEMLRYMALENMEEHRGLFWATTLEPIWALLQGHVEGRILELERGNRELDIRECLPDFALAEGENAELLHTSPLCIGRYFGWTKKHGGGERASERVNIAVSALRLIAAGHLHVNDLQGLGNKQAEGVVRDAARSKAAYERQVRDAELEKRRAEKELAQTNGATPTAKAKIEAAEKKIRAAKKAAKEKPRAAAQAAKAVLNRGGGYKEAAQAARRASGDTFDPYREVPSLDALAVKLADRLAKILDYDKDPSSSLNTGVVLAINNVDGFDDDLNRKLLMRALRDLAKRATRCADRLDEQRRLTKSDLRLLGVQ